MNFEVDPLRKHQKNAYFSFSKHCQQLLIATFSDMHTGIDASFSDGQWKDGRGRMTGRSRN